MANRLDKAEELLEVFDMVLDKIVVQELDNPYSLAEEPDTLVVAVDKASEDKQVVADSIEPSVVVLVLEVVVELVVVEALLEE